MAHIKLIRPSRDVEGDFDVRYLHVGQEMRVAELQAEGWRWVNQPNLLECPECDYTTDKQGPLNLHILNKHRRAKKGKGGK